MTSEMTLNKKFSTPYKKQTEIPAILNIKDEKITHKAMEIAKERGYPSEMGKRRFKEHFA